MANPQSERVLVVPSAELDRLGRFQGFSRQAASYLQELLTPEFACYRARSDVEDDPGFKQIIPYVVFKSSGGFEVYLSEAVIDVHSSNVLSEKPVQVRMVNGTIKANRMEVVESGNEIRFGGGVTFVMTSGNSVMHLDGKMGVP